MVEGLNAQTNRKQYICKKVTVKVGIRAMKVIRRVRLACKFDEHMLAKRKQNQRKNKRV